MQRSGWLIAVVAAMMITASSAWSQTTTPTDDRDLEAEMLSSLPSGSSVTPEMWFYIQEYQRYKSPQEAVRRKAEFRASQRQARLESQRWFGFSNLRPPANPIPYYGSYSPYWAGNSWDPHAWVGAGYPYVTFHTSSRSR